MKNENAAALPLKVPGVMYKEGWPVCMDKQIAH